MSDDHDPFLDLCERFAARGVQLKHGNIQQDMIKHLLDSLEEAEATLKGVEDRLRKLTGIQAATQPPPEPRIGESKPDGG